MPVLKKVVLSVFIGFMVFVLALGYGFFNLKSNSVYYAQRTPHKAGMEPVLMELVRNLRWTSIPGLKGIEYDFDGNNIIHNIDSTGKDNAFTYYPRGQYQYYYDNGVVAYNFDENFEYTGTFHGDTSEYSTKPVNVSAVKRDIYRTVQPVIDAQPEPLINLQWIYDWVNKDRFN